MAWLKILLTLFIILFAYNVKCEDLKEVKRFGWLRARQNYQFNHPPIVESDVSPVVYDKVIDRASRGHNLIRLSLPENSTDRSPFDKNVNILQNENISDTLKTTTALLDVKTKSEYSDFETTPDESEDATEFPNGFTTTTTYKRIFNSPKYTTLHQSKSAPVTVSYNGEKKQIVRNDIKSNLSNHRKYNRQRPSEDGSETAHSRTESKDDNTESSISHLTSADRENKIYETESVTGSSKIGLRRQRKYKNPQYNNNQSQDEGNSIRKSKINVDLEDIQIVRKASFTNRDSKSSVQNVSNEGSATSSKNALGTRRYFSRPQKVAIGRHNDAEIYLFSPDNETERTQTNTKNIIKISSLENITKNNEAEKYVTAGNVTTTITNSKTVITSDATHDKTLDLSTHTSERIRKFLIKPHRNTTYFNHTAKDSHLLTKNEDTNIQTKKTETSENKESVQLSDIKSSNMEINPERENNSKNKSQTIVKNEVTARKFLRRPHISSTNPFNNSIISQNATQSQTKETKEKSADSSNTDSLAVEVENGYKSKPQSALESENQSTKNSTYFSGTLSTTVKILDLEHSLAQRENFTDEQTKLIQSLVTNGELTTNTESTRYIKDNIEFKISQVTDTIIPTTTTESVNEDNSKLAEQVKPQISNTGRYSSLTSSFTSSNTSNIAEINITATSQENAKPNSNFSRLRNGSRGHITYQSSKFNRATNNIKSANQNIGVKRKQKRPLNEKTHVASSIDTEIANQLPKATKDSFQSNGGSEISNDTNLENFEAKPIPELKPNEPITQSSQYKNVTTDKTSDFKRDEAFTLSQQENDQVLTITTESENSHVQNAYNYTAVINSTTEQYVDKQSSSENMMQVTLNVKTFKSRNIGENTTGDASSKLNKSYEELQRTTKHSRIVKTSNTKQMKRQQLTKVGVSSSENQSPAIIKDVNEVEKPFTLKQHQSIKTSKTTIPQNSKQEGLESEGKYSTTVAINTTVKTTTLVPKTEPNASVSENPIKTSIFPQSRTKTEINNSEINLKSTVSAALIPINDVVVEKPVQYSVELDTQAKTQDDITSKTENNSSSQNSEMNYSQTSRLHGDRDPVVPIIEFENRVFSQNGKFVYSYEGADGTRAFSNGQLKEISKDHAGEAVQGGFSYTDQDGNDFSLSYTADENGYRPVGAHLPTPPPIPPAIARALAFLATKTTPEPITKPTTIK